MDRRTTLIALSVVAVLVVGGAAVYAGAPAGTFLKSADRSSTTEAKPSRTSGSSTSTSSSSTTSSTASTTTTTTQLPPLLPDGTVGAGRPPQFVIVSFDGAGNLDLMDHWLDVADRGHARFSFFLTGTYLLDQAHRSHYTGPHQAPGASSVGFAHVPEGMTGESYITTLVQRLSAARQIGHEVGTHYNGHFCQGVANPVGSWSAGDWADELDQFTGFAANISTNNGFTNPIPSPLDPGGVVGGRTPCLEGNMDALYPVLAQRGFRYDASRTGMAGEWPRKHLGLWSMTLDRINIAGTDRTNLSMDYNLYYVYSGAQEVDPPRSAEISELSYQTYVDYFESSYYGNRAPIDLGNHFERWNDSAFTNALERFVLEECVKPEVRCVPYRDLADWLDVRPPEQLAAFDAGTFPHLERPVPSPGAKGPA